MFGKSVIIAGLGVYLAIALGCMFTAQPVQTEPPGSQKMVAYNGELFRGVAMQIQRVDWMDKYKKSIDEIAALGANTIMFVVDTRQENAKSTKIYLDVRMTPTQEQLGDLIDYAKKKSLKAVLMPIVLLDLPGEDWRGTIEPALWERWFDSYREMMDVFCYVAEMHHVDVLVIGSELISAEPKVDEWNKTIAHIRERYHGLLTYSSNWDHYDKVPFWDKLDIIGMNSYWKLGNNRDVPVEEIVRNWRNIQTDLSAFCRKRNKSLLLLEAGWCSITNAADEPWDYTKTELSADNELQKKLWEGFFEAWHGTPWMAGFMMWAWSPEDPVDPKGYSPKGKPAYDVIKTWMAKPWNGKQ